MKLKMMFFLGLILHCSLADGISAPVAQEISIFDEVKKQDTSGLLAILESNPDAVNERKDNKTPLHAAAIAGNLSAAKILIEHGADVNAKVLGHEPGCTVTALHLACSRYISDGVPLKLPDNFPAELRARISGKAKNPERAGEVQEMIRLLLEKKADPNTVKTCFNGVEGETPLCMAAEAGSLELVSLLLDHGAVVEIGDKPGISAAVHAISAGSVEILELLVKKLGKLPAGKGKSSLLHSAAAKGDAEIIDLVLSYKPDVNATNTQGETPLEVALRLGKEEAIVSAYKKKGIQVPTVEVKASDIVYRASILIANGQYNEAKALLKEHPRALHAQDVHGGDVLEASFTGTAGAARTAMSKWILDQGFDVKRKSYWSTPIFFGDVDMVKLLIDTGADVNMPDKNKITPLAMAYSAQSKSTESKKDNIDAIIKLLIANGAKK